MNRSAANTAPDFKDPNVLDLEIEEEKLKEAVAKLKEEYDAQEVYLHSLPAGRKRGYAGRDLKQIGVRKRKVEADLDTLQRKLERAYTSYEFEALKDYLTTGVKMAKYSYDRTAAKEPDWDSLEERAVMLAKDANTLQNSLSMQHSWKIDRDLRNIASSVEWMQGLLSQAR